LGAAHEKSTFRWRLPVKDLVDTLAVWRAEGAGFGRAVVVRAFGSAPRFEGSTLLAADDGRIAGSVSGGCVEGAAAEEIGRARNSGLARVIRYGISDEQAWDIGLACGGVIDVLIEPAVSAAVESAARAAAGIGAQGSRAVITPLPADSPGAEPGRQIRSEGATPADVLVASEDGHLEGTLGETTFDAELIRVAQDSIARGTSRTVQIADRSLFVEVFAVRPRLVVVGAGQIAIPLAAMARAVGYETIVVDGRAAFATRERFPDVDRLIVGWPEEAAAEIRLGPADAVAILSHDAKFDEPAIMTAIAHGCRYIGVIGSRRTQSERRERLAAAGVRLEDLARLHGPIGLDLGGREPAETAMSIMAEVIATRYGGTGMSMTDKWRRSLDTGGAGSASPAGPASTSHAG
jgi:xanthine dehydrogenase accessory factor